ncbi:hypothetical protein PPMP20_11615 [Paraburkholderia phymatum]|uniref:hypothetical protein n=1 Tax=Paraburkholderia phymatum TaxID=148447 RepID=UPI0012FD6570|nr:hypothetical protein [Paraburkholderia phymatum]
MSQGQERGMQTSLRLHPDSAGRPHGGFQCFAFETLIDLFMATPNQKKKKLFEVAFPFL